MASQVDDELLLDSDDEWDELDLQLSTQFAKGYVDKVGLMYPACFALLC